MMRGVSEGGSDGGAWRGDDDDTKQMDEEEWVVKGDTNDRGEDAGEEEDETAVNEPVVKKRRPRQKPRSRKEPEHRTHFCPHCPMAFYRAEHLGRHLRIHSGEKPYKCDFCGRCFGRSDEVARHSKVHTKRKKPKSGVRRPRKKKNCFVTTDTDVN
ncbi:uncharacterized protein EV422DRAFT_560787, partial [Fimicolochytrium jonesii]|uniref:uncharacterized protein n=1 Tax=Fimicolochytrium jonesii TaxID=1396493 RepID=UPI0022FEDEF5